MSTPRTPHRQPPKVPRPDPVERGRSDVLTALGEAPSQGDVDAFWSEHAGRLPLVEATDGPDRWRVTFCWRDAEAAEVFLFVNRLTDETRLHNSLMERLGDTDLWHLTYVLGPAWRASYAFLPRAHGEQAPWLGDGDQVRIRTALDRGQADPANPDSCLNRAGVRQSVAATPHAPAQRWLARRGDVTPGRLVADVLDDGRPVWLHDPAGVADETPLPALVVLDGEVWNGTQDLPTTLDNLVADGLVPGWRTILVASGGREQRWDELGAGAGGGDLVVDQVLPWLRARRCVQEGPAAVTVAGQSLGGLSALRTVLHHGDAVGNAISHSASLWQDDLLDAATLPNEPGRLWIHLGHGEQEWVLAGPHLELGAVLGERGFAVDAVAYDGGHDYAWWRGALADALLAQSRHRAP
ncbi:MAG: enterochelin esterase domain-containing protein [Nocardioides sp.]|uniref:enterochelin esterase domain-containing protein n=1 Tax=Nocardioides sp. TaxID=35761 RepID=UPI003EFCE3C0